MAKKSKSTKITLPVIVEKDEDGFYVVECPLLKGCYSQGETLDEALKNIREVIEMCLEEESEDEISDIALIQEFSFHTVALEA
jgi:predicted RNase H-like HicB family nuclease